MEMKYLDRVKFKGAELVAVVQEVNENTVTVKANNGDISLPIPIGSLEIVTIIFEVINMLKSFFATKLPLEIAIGDRDYCLNLRYDHSEKKVFAYYRDVLKEETLIGIAYGKNTSEAKKKLKNKLKEAGYL